MNPVTGVDIDPSIVDKIDAILNGAYTPASAVETAQLRELAFWRWVAYEGYNGQSPDYFPKHQKQFMTACMEKTGWPISGFEADVIFELGCGPLGMIEFMPAKVRYAFDPLNDHYSKLFMNYRSKGIHYISDESQFAALEPMDFGICFNVIDHTSNAREYFDLFMRKIKDRGRFIIEVNTIRDGFDRTEEHKRMHPSPLKFEEVWSWILEVSDDAQYQLSDSPSADNEFFFMAWGTKHHTVGLARLIWKCTHPFMGRRKRL